MRVGYVDAQASYEVRAAEARFPDDEARSVSQTDLPMALTRAEGQSVVERWLAESRIARDGARFALPKSRIALGAGDVVRFEGQRHRIDRVEQAESQVLEAIRVEPGVYVPGAASSETIETRAYVPPVPVLPLFLDLPLLTGSEVPHAPHVAVSAEPWPGSVAVWSSSQDNRYELNRLVATSSVIGFTESPLLRARPGVWDRGVPLRVRLSTGELSSADPVAVLNGANAMAIGDGSNGRWEVFQFRDAQIVAPDTYELSTRLRGQAGTDGLMPDVWPIGSTVVLLDLTLTQIDLPLSARGLARYYRIGAGSRGVDDINVVTQVEAFDGAGLRPYPVAHLRALVDDLGTLQISWKRRTRIDGDTWQSVEVPLGEDSESYVVRLVQNDIVQAEYTTSVPSFAYSPSMQVVDGITGPFQVAVAQVSASFGPGFFRSVSVPA